MASIVALIDYGSGNLRSAEKALARAASEDATGHEIIVTDKPDVVAGAERIVLPGVGAFADCMSGLSKLPGMIDALNDAVIAKGRPFLGICVGMQLMARVGREFGDTAGAWLDRWRSGAAHAFRCCAQDSAYGVERAWRCSRLHALTARPAAGCSCLLRAFFRNAREAIPRNVIARTDYGGPVTAIVGRDNIVGTQFHPEKSQAVGLALLGNFLKWRP